MFLQAIRILLLLLSYVGFTQEVSLSFSLIDELHSTDITNATVKISNNDCNGNVSIDGVYLVNCLIINGEHELLITHPDYKLIRMHIIVNKGVRKIDLGQLSMKPLLENLRTEFTLIDNLDELLSEEEDKSSQTLLSSGKDQFWNSVAFHWRGAFFRPRGLDSEENTILINGVKMNSFFNGRFAWGTISGLNAMMRSQQTTLYTDANPYDFGGMQGTNTFQFGAQRFRKGAYVSLSNTNSTYQGRLIANYNTGVTAKGWAFSGLLSSIYGEEGYIEGTTFKQVGGLFSVYKELTTKHQLNATLYFTPNSRGRSTAITNEIIQLKERQYNPLWGKQGDKIRNSRVRTISAPTITLNHHWQPNRSIEVQNNILFQHSKISSSRIEFNGKSISGDGQTFIGTSQNPDPTYYQKLPSNFLQLGGEDFEKAFLAQQFLVDEGQLNWNLLYQQNTELPLSAFILYSDVNEDQTIAVNSLGQIQINDHLNLQYKIAYQNYNSQNYAVVNDLLGGRGYLDIDAFEEGTRAQSDLRNQNRIVGVDDIFKYNYKINASRFTSFAQFNYSLKRSNMFVATEVQSFSVSRTGLFENGLFPGIKSLGKSNPYSTFTTKLKGGLTYNINNKWYAQVQGLFGTTPPSIRKIFVNSRQNNDLVKDLKNLYQFSIDVSLKYQYEKWRLRVSAYHIEQKDDASVRFFFTEDIAGLGRQNNSEFVQQTITGIETQRQGIEFGINYDLTSTLKINASGSYGKHLYNNNAKLQLSADSFNTPLDLGEVRLKNYRLANGPQQAYGLGFTYRDPKFWWFNTQLNYLDDISISISEILRTNSFATDVDGQPILEYDETRARELLQQEQLPGYFLWNATGGKSWKIDDYYIGFTLGIQNILNQFYKTGGFEQARRGNFSSLNAERNQQFPLFGNRYWVGRGTTYYLNMYLRF